MLIGIELVTFEPVNYEKPRVELCFEDKASNCVIHFPGKGRLE